MRPHRLLVALALPSIALACQEPSADGPAAEPLAQVARSASGVVSAAQPLAARAGAEMLELGGNAVDAAVSAAFALAVVEPSMSGLGGRAQILIRTPEGEYVGIDGTTQAPASYDPDTAPQASYGYAVIGVPGVPAALLRAHNQFGVLPRSTVMAEAIRLAEEGFELLPNEAARHASAAEELAEFPGSRAKFLGPDGAAHPAGSLFRQPILARTLRTLAEEGEEAFYRGSIAREMARDIQANGGAVTLEALGAYQAEESRVVRGSYRDHDLAGLWLPSFGAITIQILHLMETVDAGAISEEQWAMTLSEAIRVAYLDRPAQEDEEDAERLTSHEYARQRASLMRLPAELQRAAAGTGSLEGSRAAPVGDGELQLMAATGTAADLPPAWLEEMGHTTHLSAADGRGMMVALTQSLGPSLGSKVVSPELGFVYASTLGGYLGRMEPGERARSHISPFMVERDGAPFLALGAAGGGRIPTAIAAAVSRIVDRGMTLEEALAAPRVVPATGRQSEEGDPDAPLQVDLEVVEGMGFDSAAVAFFRERGYEVDPVDRVGAFGRIHAVRWLADQRVWVGVADPDWEGAAATPREVIR